jgi:hypothetical protein
MSLNVQRERAVWRVREQEGADGHRQETGVVPRLQ